MPYRAPQTISAPDRRATYIRYWVLAAFCAAAAIAYIQRNSMTVLSPAIQDETQLDKPAMGRVMSGFYWGYALMQIPWGWLGVRWGSRKTLAVCALAWSVATGLMSLGTDQYTLFSIWTLMGMAQAGLFPCVMIGLGEWLPSTRRAVASGMLSMFMNVGAVLAPLLAGVLLYYSTWAQTFLWLSMPGLIWASWYFWWYRDRPAEHESVNDAERTLIAAGAAPFDSSRHSRPRTPWRRLATSFRMWLICAQHFLRAAAQVFFGTWFGTFVKESPGISASEVPILSSLPPMMLIAGAALGGGVSDWLLHRTQSRRVSRQALAVLSMSMSAALYGAAALAENAYLRVGLISVACLFVTMGGVSAYAITMDLGGLHVAAVFSTMNMCGSVGAAVFPDIAGRVVANTANWDSVIWLIAGIYVAAAACWALLNPDGTLFGDDDSNHEQR